VHALNDVTVDVPPGAVVAVVGGDGAGKTTLLRALVREIKPDTGQVSAPAAAGIGFLPASSASWASLSVTQNVDFAGGVFGLTGPALADRRDRLLAGAGLTAAAGRLASQLSGGMRRKLGFCMAIVSQPVLLVLDEPSTGVDPVSRIDLWRLISEAAAAGTAVIMSTTHLDEAERAAQLVVLDGGQVLVQGPYDRSGPGSPAPSPRLTSRPGGSGPGAAAAAAASTGLTATRPPTWTRSTPTWRTWSSRYRCLDAHSGEEKNASSPAMRLRQRCNTYLALPPGRRNT
jgi:ABC-2 type transport system ATP-binding protein